jgi:UDP-N-acetylmuramyl pentapeptide synthase
MSGLPPDIHEFLVAHFDSVEALEIALLLRRSSDAFWAATAVADHLGIRKETAEAKIASLVNSGLVVRGGQSGAYRFNPSNDALRANMDALANAYADRRVTIMNTIYSANLERLRAFSSAFRLKKE